MDRMTDGRTDELNWVGLGNLQFLQEKKSHLVMIKTPTNHSWLCRDIVFQYVEYHIGIVRWFLISKKDWIFKSLTLAGAWAGGTVQSNFFSHLIKFQCVVFCVTLLSFVIFCCVLCHSFSLGCTLLFSVRNIFLPIYSNFSIPAVFLSIPVITAVICSQ